MKIRNLMRKFLWIAVILVIIVGMPGSLPVSVDNAELSPAIEIWNRYGPNPIRDKPSGSYVLTNDPDFAIVDCVKPMSSGTKDGEQCRALGDPCANSDVRDIVEPDSRDDPEGNPVIEALTLDTGSLTSLPGWHWYASYDDYAPCGMPDFDQSQDGWVGACGPTAVANCLWWLDSKYADPAGVPGDGKDTFPLVRDYGAPSSILPGPDWDDHNSGNVNDLATSWPPNGSPPATPTFVPGPQHQPSDMPAWGELVERVAWYVDYGGIRTGSGARGTSASSALNGATEWLEEEGLDFMLGVTLVEDPDFGFIAEAVERGESAVLIIGAWYEEEPNVWKRASGHFVAVAGVNSDELLIAISDSSFDQIPAADPQEHNDASIVSHDIWRVDLDSPRSDGRWWLVDYAATTYAQEYHPDTTTVYDGIVERALIIFPAPPSVTTQAASAIGTRSVSLNMTYTLGGQTTVYLRFAYRQAGDTDWTEVPWLSASAPCIFLSNGGTHEETLTGLEPNTAYEFKAELRYDEIVTQGDLLTFTTREEGGCFIATAAYGTPMAEELQILREFRDEYLLTNSLGQGLVDVYYTISPPIANFITDHPSLKPIVRAGLTPVVAMCSIVFEIVPGD